MIRITQLVELGEGQSVTVRELTVAEVRAWLLEGEREKGNKPSAMESVGILFLEDTTLQDIAYMTGLELQDFDSFTSSQVARILEVCKSLNAPFFRIQKEIARMFQTANAANVSQSKP